MKKIILPLLILCLILSISCRNRHRGTIPYISFARVHGNVDFTKIKTFAFDPESLANDPAALERQIASQMSNLLHMREVRNEIPDITVRFKYAILDYGRTNFFDGSYKQGNVIDNFTIEFFDDFDIILSATYPTAVNALNSRNLVLQTFVDIRRKMKR